MIFYGTNNIIRPGMTANDKNIPKIISFSSNVDQELVDDPFAADQYKGI